MKSFWIDFSGYCKVEASNEEEARKIFWDNVSLGSDIFKDTVFADVSTEEVTVQRNLDRYVQMLNI